MVADSTLLDSFIELLLRRPSPREIMEFNATDDQNERLNFLLAKNKSQRLSFDEQLEVEYCMRANHYVAMAKIKADHELSMSGE